MLVLTRKPGEKIIIDGNITVTVVEVSGQRVRLAFEAPAHVNILRQEVLARQTALDESDQDLQAKPAEWSLSRMRSSARS